MNDTAIISRMQHFSTDDGDGIRTTIFFQGCNLHCMWCHNPETWSAEGSLLLHTKLCSLCGACAEVCPTGAHILSPDGHRLDRNKCKLCGRCAQQCITGAIVHSGTKITLKSAFEYIVQDKHYYDATGGGVTFSGGEPLLQADFCAALAEMCVQEGINVFVDTAACVDFSAFEKLIPFTKRFMVDLKASCDQDYQKWTGGSFDKVVDNLKRLREADCDILIRTPVIPGFNDTKEALSKYADVMLDLDIHKAELLPFHRLGSAKYTALQREYKFENTLPPTKQHMQELKDFMSERLKSR